MIFLNDFSMESIYAVSKSKRYVFYICTFAWLIFIVVNLLGHILANLNWVWPFAVFFGFLCGVLFIFEGIFFSVLLKQQFSKLFKASIVTNATRLKTQRKAPANLLHMFGIMKRLTILSCFGAFSMVFTVLVVIVTDVIIARCFGCGWSPTTIVIAANAVYIDWIINLLCLIAELPRSIFSNIYDICCKRFENIMFFKRFEDNYRLKINVENASL